ncbi:MAG: type 1 glutamine amidotransferase domain-containing protein [Candidatus Eisenbacteria bacterium]
MDLQGKHIALLVAPMFRDEEVFEPIDYFNARRAEVVVIGLSRARVFGKLGGSIVPDKSLAEVLPGAFDAVILPGGQAPETLRLHPAVLAFVRAIDDRHVPIAAICHGPQVLISADRLRGRRATCYKGIRDDVKLAGARYEDAPVVIDGHLITAREPGDLPQFHAAIEDALLKTMAAR